MPQQNNNPNAHRQNEDGKDTHKMAPGHDNRPQEAKDNNQGDKPGHKATSNNNNKDNR
jgi:hypothetical protein